MATINVPPITSRPPAAPEPIHPAVEPNIGDTPKPIETTASSAADGLDPELVRPEASPASDPTPSGRVNTPAGAMPVIGPQATEPSATKTSA